MSQSNFKLKKLENAPDGDKFKGFNCGNDFLNKVTKTLVTKDGLDEFKPFVLVDTAVNNRYIGYITLQSHSIDKQEFKGQFSSYGNNVPVQLIQFIAVDKKYQKQGHGELLLQTVFKSAVAISKVTGTTGVVLESHPDAVEFYTRMGFTTLKVEHKHGLDLSFMWISIADIRYAMEDTEPELSPG